VVKERKGGRREGGWGGGGRERLRERDKGCVCV